MANHLGCSKSTIYKKLRELNMPMRARFSQISDDELKITVAQIHQEHPRAGHIVISLSLSKNFQHILTNILRNCNNKNKLQMMQSYLKAAGVFVPRHRTRETLNAIDPIGAASRWSQAIRRRSYKVATPNSLWHIDAHLKLSRYTFFSFNTFFSITLLCKLFPFFLIFFTQLFIFKQFRTLLHDCL